MTAAVPTVQVTLWRADALVLYDWLNRVDLGALPVEHKAEKQALADLVAALERFTDVEYAEPGELEVAREEVARNMGW